MGCPAPGCGKIFCTEEMLEKHTRKIHGKTYTSIIWDLRGWTREGKNCYGTCPLCHDVIHSTKRNRHFTVNHLEVTKEEFKSIMPTMQELTEIIRAEFDIVPINAMREKAKRAKLSEPSDDGDE